MVDPRNVYTVGEAVPESWRTSLEDHVTIHHEHEEGLGESYRIRIQEDRITITSDHPRGTAYAFDTLHRYLEDGRLCYGLIEDGPAFPMRGVIEGFYGPPWSHEDRKDMLRFLRDHRMNTYIYAPKDDPYHRHKWRDPYPSEIQTELRDLIDTAKDLHIDFVFSISPGNDFRYTDEADFAALFAKIDAVAAYGVTDFALLLDDIDYQLEGDNKRRFERPGQAHAYITNRLHEHLTTTMTNHSLVFCPTEYWQQVDSPYRTDLRNELAKDVPVFWTGYNTVAEYIPNYDAERVRRQFGHDLVLWDNYPVNDMATDMVFLGPLYNRGDRLNETHVGMVSNPMVQWHLSKLAVATMAEYMWNPATYNPQSSYDRAIALFAPTEVEQDALARVLALFQRTLIRYDIDPLMEQAIDEHRDAAFVDGFYQSLQPDIERVRRLPDQRFTKEFEPWLARIEFDARLAHAIAANDTDTVQELLVQVPDLAHTVNANYAVQLAIRLGLYDGPLYKKERPNYWR
jgi:hyaluronoglucosaminidase